MKLDPRVEAVVKRYFKGENLEVAISKEKAKLEVKKIYNILAEAKGGTQNGKGRV